MKAGKIIKIFFRLMGIIGICTLIWSWNTYGSFVMAANSVKKLNDHFYYMEFKGNLQLKEYLECGGSRTNEHMAKYIEALLRGKRINKVFKEEVPFNTGCAAISAKDSSGQQFFGRNYDWNNLDSAIIIKSSPKKGYKSISTVQLDFLGFGDNFKPDTFANRYLACAGLFVPLDGMNEKGLCISDLLAGDEEITNQNTEKSDVTTTLAIRAILDYCADVPEAIKFLEEHDMNSVIGYAHHLAIKDTSGRMVVVEYMDNKMMITESNVVTNHYLCTERDVIGKENSTLRYNILQSYFDENTTLSEEQIKSALYAIRSSQYHSAEDDASKTWWRIVFNQNDLTCNYVLEEKYDSDSELIFKL